MRDRRECVVATTGTSLLTNVQEMVSAGDSEIWIAAQPPADQSGLRESRQLLADAAKLLERGAWDNLGTTLAALRGQPRLLGAEVACLSALRAEGAYAALRTTVLLHSDTAEGEAAALALRGLLSTRFGLIVDLRRIVGLQAENPSLLKVVGLRNLVRELARQVEKHGPKTLVIDATGGFKAQVALAVVFGQAFGIPVVYRFERFSEIIEFPPLPFTLDIETVAGVRDLLEMDAIAPELLAQRMGVPLSEANPSFARVGVLLSSTLDQTGREVYTASPFGQLALEVWKRQQSSKAR